MRQARNFLLLCVPYSLLVLRFRFVTDDAYISFRYARNLAAGHGLRFNLSETVPVEGYSNLLWVLVGALFERLGLDIAVSSRVLSAACGYLLLWLVLRASSRRRDVSETDAAWSTLTLAAFPPFAVWSTGGLETMPFALFVFLTFDLLVLRDRPGGVGAGIAALGLVLLRVDGIAWAAVILALAAIVHRRRVTALLPAATILFVGYAAHTTWHHSYYGQFFANTVQAKVGENISPEGWLRGLRYVGTHWLTFLVPLLLVPASVSALRAERRPAGPAVAAMAWAAPVYATLVTGDFMGMGRLLVPGFAFQTILIAWLLHDVSERPAIRAAIAGAVSFLALLPAGNLHVVPASLREAAQFRRGPYAAERTVTEYEFWANQKASMRDNIAKGIALRRYVQARPFEKAPATCVTGPLGGVGYYSGLEILDRQGLVTPSVLARFPRRSPGEATPGHDRGVPYAFFLDQAPEILRAHLVSPAHPCSVWAICDDLARGIRRSPEKEMSRYAVDLFAVPESDSPGGSAALVVWRRSDDDVDAAWQAHEARQDSLLERGNGCYR